MAADRNSAHSRSRSDRDDVKVELVEVKDQNGADSLASRALLRPAEHRDAGMVRKVFGAKPRPPEAAAPFRNGHSAGRRLNFSPSPIPSSARTAARSITSGSRSRTSRRSPRSWKRTASSWTGPTAKFRRSASPLRSSRTPRGTSIELTEGLDAVRLDSRRGLATKRHIRHIKAAFMCLLCFFVANPLLIINFKVEEGM